MRRFANEALISGRSVERSTARMHSGLSRLTRFMSQQITGTIRSFFYGMRMGMVGAGAAVSAFVLTSLKSFRDFDKKLRETTSLIAGSGQGGLKNSFKEAEKAYKDFYRTMLRLAPQMRRTPQELASGLYEIVQAGITQPAAAKRLLKPAAMGATAGGGSVDASARVLVQIMNALKMGTSKPGAGKQAQAVMDRIFQAINLGVGVDFGSLSQGIGKFIGGAGVTFKGGRKGGLKSLDELMATYIFATQQGARTADVGVGIQDVIKTIANPSVKSAKFAKSIGLQTGSSFLNQHGFVGSLTTIIAKMKEAGYTGERLNDAIGKFFADVRGRRIVQYAANLDMVKQAMKGMGLATDSTSRAFREQGKSLDAATQTFKSYWETAKIAIGGATAPYAVRGMSAVTNALTDAGVVGRGQDLVDEASGMRGKKRASFVRGMSIQDHVLYDRARQFNKAGFTGKISQIGNQALTNLTAWWKNPATQSKFNALLQSTIQKSFDMAGKMIRQIPSIYEFGRKVGGEIIRGTVDALKSGVSGALSGGGGGAGGFGSLVKGTSDPYQAVAGGLMSMFVLSRGAGKGGLGRGLAAGGALTLAGAPPALAAAGALLPLLLKGKRGGGGGTGASAEELISTMNVRATNVNIQGGGGAVGGGGRKTGPTAAAGAPPSSLAAGYAAQRAYSDALKPGYTHLGGNRFKGPDGKFVSGADAMLGPVPFTITEKATKDTINRIGRIKAAAQRARGAIAGSAPGRFAGSRGGRMAMLGAAGAGLAGAQGMDTTQMVLGGVGMASMALGPEVGIPVMIGTSVLGSVLANRGKGASHGQNVVDRIFGKKGSKYDHSGFANNTFGGSFGSGFNVSQFNRANPLKWSGNQYSQARLFADALNKAVATPWDKPDQFSSNLEQALKWGGSNQDAQDAISEIYSRWNDYALTMEAKFTMQRNTGSRLVGGRTAKERAYGSKLHKGGKAVDSAMHGAEGREAPLAANVRAVKNKNSPMAAKFWDENLNLIKPRAEAAGRTGPKVFTFGFKQEADKLPTSLKPTIDTMIATITNMTQASIGTLGSGGTGPSAGAPPPAANGAGSTPGSRGMGGPMHGRSNNVKVFGASSIHGDMGSVLGDQMGTAGAAVT